MSLGERELPWRSEALTNHKFLVTSYFGAWTVLNQKEFHAFQQHAWTPALHSKLERAGLVLNKNNSQAVMQKYVGLNRHLFMRPSLHILNVTNTCNYRCVYCHAGVSQGKEKMSIETAAKALNFIFDSSGGECTIEFQGGEPLLNWPVVKFVTEQARAMNKANKPVSITLVSNLSLLDDEKLNFLLDNHVQICTSLDGSAEVHNANRARLGGGTTQEQTVQNIKRVNEAYAARGLQFRAGALCTVTKHALEFPKQIVDAYVALGIPIIPLRPLHNLGDALKTWNDITYSAEEFVVFWKQALDYMLELNKNCSKKTVVIFDQTTLNILSKLLLFKDPLYIENMSITGSGRGTLLYNHDGALYSSDEGRMTGNDLFKIGTVDESPSNVLSNDDLINTWASSFIDLYAYNSAFRPWIGLHPVLVYKQFGHPIPRITDSFWYKVLTAQCKHIVELLCVPETAEMFKNWILYSSGNGTQKETV